MVMVHLALVAVAVVVDVVVLTLEVVVVVIVIGVVAVAVMKMKAFNFSNFMDGHIFLTFKITPEENSSECRVITAWCPYSHPFHYHLNASVFIFYSMDSLRRRKRKCALTQRSLNQTAKH